MGTEKHPLKNEFDFAPYGRDENGEAYGPNPTQQFVLDWVDAVRRGEYKAQGIPVLYLKGGVGSGKTRGMLAPVCEMLFECPDLRALWGRQDFKDLKLSAMDTFFAVLPTEVVLEKSEQYHWYDIWTGKNKKTGKSNKPSRIYFNGLKDISGLGSQEFAVIVITEAHETTENSYRALKRRCRQAGFPVMILMESEPPNESHWLERVTNPVMDEYDPDITMRELSTYENWKNLPIAYRESLESMPKSWQRKYLYGKAGFIPDGRPFYEGFREEIHAGNFTYNPSKLLTGSWDFGFHHPAFTVHQLDDMGRWYVLAELVGSEITIDKFCDQVQALINTMFPDAVRWSHVGDPACRQTNDKSEKTSWQICRDKGFNLMCRQSTYRARKEIIDGKLSKMINGKPMMLVDLSCRVSIDGFLGGYHYPERKPGHAITADDEIPVKDGFYEHSMNTIEYFAINTFKVIERKKSEEDEHRYRYRSGEKVHNAGFSFSGGR